jgi:hypothetical protein
LLIEKVDQDSSQRSDTKLNYQTVFHAEDFEPLQRENVPKTVSDRCNQCVLKYITWQLLLIEVEKRESAEAATAYYHADEQITG